MHLRTILSQIWNNVQFSLFPQLENESGPLSKKHKMLIAVLELIKIEYFVSRYYSTGVVGRPLKDRVALARAFVAKIIFKLKFTNQLRDYLLSDKQLRRICGWESVRQIPSESKFSRVFGEFAVSKLPEHVHKALITDLYQNEVVVHVTKDSTPIKAREQPFRNKKNPPSKKTAKKIGRPKKGEIRDTQLTRIERQSLREMSIEEMVNELPRNCDIGKKKSPSGHHLVWKGYKLHVAVDDNCVPLAAIITSASMQDNQVAIPLAEKSNEVVTNLYDLMDANYDVKGVLAHSRSLGHVPIVDSRPANRNLKELKRGEMKRRKVLNWHPAETKRYHERRKSERFNALFKDFYGGEVVHYRGHAKASCHLMFGVLALAASLLLNL